MLEQPDPAPPDLFGTKGAARRLRTLTAARLEPGEEAVAWTRAAISRDGRFNVLLAARTPCFVVLTSRRMMCWSVGFFSRRPRHRVLTDRIDELKVKPVGAPPRPNSRLRVQAFARKPLRFDLGHDERDVRFAQVLLDASTPAAPRAALPDFTEEAPADPSPSADAPKEKESRWRRW